jgi:probable phosphoglycerate mutase
MTGSTKIHFVRHGKVDNPRGVFYGRLPGFALSEEGRHHAQAAAEALQGKPLAAVHSSPLLRARQTAEIILKPHEGLTLQISDLLCEVHSPFDGQPDAVLADRNWDVYTGVEPQYEQPADVLGRARQFVAHVCQQYAGRHVAAVTHGDLVAFLMLEAKGLPITPAEKQMLYADYLAPGSIATFVYEPGADGGLSSLEYLKPY